MAQEQGLIKVQDNMSSKIGKKVYYTDPQGNKINGKIKARHSTKRSVFFVVYDCGGNWDHFMNYQGIYTKAKDLTLGWKEEDPEYLAHVFGEQIRKDKEDWNEVFMRSRGYYGKTMFSPYMSFDQSTIDNSLSRLRELVNKKQ